jgi:hypothetical protein
MTTWILILCVYAGPWANGDSVSVTSVPGFGFEQECQRAGEAAKALTKGTKKETRYVCVPQSPVPR